MRSAVATWNLCEKHIDIFRIKLKHVFVSARLRCFLFPRVRIGKAIIVFCFIYRHRRVRHCSAVNPNAQKPFFSSSWAFLCQCIAQCNHHGPLQIMANGIHTVTNPHIRRYHCRCSNLVGCKRLAIGSRFHCPRYQFWSKYRFFWWARHWLCCLT